MPSAQPGNWEDADAPSKTQMHMVRPWMLHSEASLTELSGSFDLMNILALFNNSC